MQRQIRRAASYPLAIALTGALAVFGVSACGGSSGSSTARTGTAASPAAARNTAGGIQQGKPALGAGPRFTALRECLQRNGVKLPPKGAGRGLFLGGAGLPAGVTRTQLQTAMRKCLGGRGHFFAGSGPLAARRFDNQAFRKSLSDFASCLRQNGIDLPAPNTSGKGPVFSTKGIDTATPKFREATKKCRGVLSAAFKSRP